MEPLTVLTFVFSGGILVWGYLVGIGRRSSFMPRFTSKAWRSERLVLSWVGFSLMVTGFLGVVAGVLQYLFPLTHVYMFLAYFAVILPLMGVRVVRGLKRYEAS